MSAETFLKRIRDLKDHAESIPVGQKRSSLMLYAVLSDCMSLALDCKTWPEERRALMDLIQPERTDPRSRKGLVYSDTSEFQLVCRFVFQGKGSSNRAETSNASRYGKALEEAWRRGVGACAIYSYLKDGGGISQLYHARPTAKDTFEGKTLLLNQRITVPKGGSITLTLRHRGGTKFDVVSDV